MNLPDLIRRSDRAVQVAAGSATPTVLKWEDEPRNVAVLEAGTELLLQRADEFLCLRSLPIDIGWRVWKVENGSRNTASLAFIAEIVNASRPSECNVLFSAGSSVSSAQPILFNWPEWARRGEAFHLRLKNIGSIPVAVDSGVSFNSRGRLLPLLRGKGVEIGPGLNPHILPSDGVDVSYVEAASAEDWVRNYKKTDKPSVAEQNNLWSKYIVGDAQLLSSIPDGSLDFIYSNHVFEHLMNPIGVLESWRRKLTHSGIVVGIVPDCRYTFDLRQHPSTTEDWIRERAAGKWDTTWEQ